MSVFLAVNCLYRMKLKVLESMDGWCHLEKERLVRESCAIVWPSVTTWLACRKNCERIFLQSG